MDTRHLSPRFLPSKHLAPVPNLEGNTILLGESFLAFLNTMRSDNQLLSGGYAIKKPAFPHREEIQVFSLEREPGEIASNRFP